MLQKSQFPENLMLKYQQTSNKLKKFERQVFKRFAPNVAEVSSDFCSLAKKFEDSRMTEYSGMCYLGSAKCEKTLGSTAAEIDYLLKSARSFVKAEDDLAQLELRSNDQKFIEGALKSYSEVLLKLDDDSVMKAAVIREIKKAKTDYDNISNFCSPCHRIYDLEVAASVNIRSCDYVSALEKLTEIFDDVTERKIYDLYSDVMNRIEITRLLLLLILDLPPSRQSPSHIKLIEQYSNVLSEIPSDENLNQLKDPFRIPNQIQLSLQDLTISCLERDSQSVMFVIETLLNFTSLTGEQTFLLLQLNESCRI